MFLLHQRARRFTGYALGDQQRGARSRSRVKVRWTSASVPRRGWQLRAAESLSAFTASPAAVSDSARRIYRGGGYC